MSSTHTGNVQPSIDLEEHRSKNVNAKAVVDHGYIPGTDQYVPITAVDNGDGTYGLKTSSTPAVGGSTSELQEQQDYILNQINANLAAIANAKGIAADLRVTLLSGILTTLTTVTTVTTVTTLAGITNIGAQPATTFLPNQQNQTAILSNINNVLVT